MNPPTIEAGRVVVDAPLDGRRAIDAAIERYNLAIPEALKCERIWLLWKAEPSQDAKKPLKVPYYANGSRRSGVQGSDADRVQLATYREALATFAGGGYAGLGIAHVPGCGFVSLDFDNCVDERGNILEDVRAFVYRCGTYAEMSPSGRGVRVIARGKLPSVKKLDTATGRHVEVFGDSGFVTVTGRVLIDADVCELTQPCLSGIRDFLADACKDGEHSRGDQLNATRAADHVYQQLRRLGVIKSERNDGRVFIRCPFEHKSGVYGDTDTAYFLPHTQGYSAGHFKCQHASCGQREDRDFRIAFGIADVDISGLLGSVARGMRTRAVVRRLSDVRAFPIRWLWPGRIARGKVSMIAGHPGLGKSQITAALAAVVTTGGRWPVDGASCERGRVILLNAEDDAADTIRPRLEAAGAALDYCEVLDAVSTGVGPDGREATRGFSLKVDVGVLDELLTARKDVALVVIDPITAYLAGVDSHVNADVRAVLAPLGELAVRHGVAIICVSHLNKGGAATSEALLRVSGSLAFVAAARAAFIVAKDPEDSARRLFVPAKNNIGKDASGLAFSIESCALPGGIETSRILWESEPVSITADDVMTPPRDEGDRTMTDEAVDLLRDVLSAGRVLARDIKRRAGEAGITDKALRTARERLGVVASREGFGADTKTFWALGPLPFVPSEPTRAQ